MKLRRHLFAAISSLFLLGVTIAAMTSIQIYLAHAAASPNPNCTLIVPANPLTAPGLATPYQLRATNPEDGACHEANADQAAFVQGAIIDKTGHVAIYNPLVVDSGMRPAVPPLVPLVQPGSTVALWFGFNGDTLHLAGATGKGNCVNGLGKSLFGQYAYCNAPAFFARAKGAAVRGQLVIPPLGMARDGMPCPTVRDFSVVDQDQSDNVTTTYLVTNDGKTAQNTAANSVALASAAPFANGSDNRLLAVALDNALGCKPFTAPDLADPGKMVTALPLNELSAWMFQKQPTALVPLGDPMTLLGNGNPSIAKTNLYRLGVGQHPLGGDLTGSTRAYCHNLLTIAPARLLLDKPLTTAVPSADPAVANTLFTFLAQRLAFTLSIDGLNCVGLLKVQNPVVTTVNADGVVIGAKVNGN
jgi:hypothetical protein